MLRIIGLIAISLIILSIVAGTEPATTQTPSNGPTKSGLWLKRVALTTSTCQSRDSAWGWESEGTRVFLLDANGDQIHSWNLGEPLRTVSVTDDCEMAWVTSSDGLKVFAIDKHNRDNVIALPAGQKLPQMADFVCPIQGKRSAWVLNTVDTAQYPVVKLESEGNVLRAVPRSDIPPRFVITDHSHALGTSRLWIVPQGKGLNVVQDGAFKTVSALDDVNVVEVYTASDDRFAWVLPEKRMGVYLVDAEGEVLNGGRPILPDENIGEVHVSKPKVSDIAWLRTVENKVFAVRWSAQTGVLDVLNGGRPLTTPSGGPLEISALVTPNGSVAWAQPPAERTPSHLYPGVWRLAIEKDDSVSATEIDPRSFGSQGIRQMFSDSQRPERVWVKTADRSFYEIRLGDQISGPSLSMQRSGCLNIVGITPSSMTGRYWVRTDSDSFVMGGTDELQTATLRIDGHALSLVSHGPQRFGVQLVEQPEMEVNLDWPARTATSNGTASVRVFAQNPTGQRLLMAEGSGQLVAGQGRVRLTANSAVDKSVDSDVELVYQDDLGSRLTVTWPQVTFEVSILDQILHNRVVRSLLLLLLPTSLALALFGQRLAIRKWTPVAIPLLDVCAIKFAPQVFNLSLLDLGISAALLFMFFVVAGLSSPWVFQRLASVQPFTVMASIVLMFPRARRHVFREYLAMLRRELAAQRVMANDEDYVTLPIEVERVQPSPTQVIGEAASATNVEQLARLITAINPRERAHLVLHGPGGRGKTALLNELLERTIDAYLKDPRCPLPIVGDRRLKSFEEMVERALANFGGTAVSSRLIESGNLVVFIDDLGESQVDPLNIETFMCSVGALTRICATIRSGSVYLKAIDRGDRVLVVAPARLDEANLAAFVEHYNEADAKKSGKPQASVLQHTDASRLATICKSTDGCYLPLLVRLAMRANAHGRELTSVSDIYEGSLELLLKRGPNEDEQLWRAVEELARVTYWEEHTRLIATTRVKAGEAQLIDSLLKAGVLVHADREPSLIRSTPRQVRFFHDSVQSYLAARALGRLAQWDALASAAGEEWFQRARSDIMGESTSELYAMCVQVFRPVDLLRERLAEQLWVWQARYHSELTANQVIDAVPEQIRPTVLEAVDQMSGSAECLGTAIVKCKMEDEGCDDATRLGVLYGRLAPFVWPFMKASIESATEKAA
jgi:hypothetical protein